jgi:NADH:ubiquinone oxidoreductase subunit C
MIVKHNELYKYENAINWYLKRAELKKEYKEKGLQKWIQQTKILKINLLQILHKYIITMNFNKYDMFLLIKPSNLFNVLYVLNKNTVFQFKQLIDISTIDYVERINRFELIYQLLSMVYNRRLNIRTFTNELFGIHSIISLFNNSNWSERECFDMFGIFFINHPDLRRILTDYGFDGFPLRKDFPLSGFKEIMYEDNKKLIIYTKITFMQEYRYYKYTNNWIRTHGPEYILHNMDYS